MAVELLIIMHNVHSKPFLICMAVKRSTEEGNQEENKKITNEVFEISDRRNYRAVALLLFIRNIPSPNYGWAPIVLTEGMRASSQSIQAKAGIIFQRGIGPLPFTSILIRYSLSILRLSAI
jgi:hypothetical protein